MNDSIRRILYFAAVVVNASLSTAFSLGSNDFVVAKVGDRVVLRCPSREEENSCHIWNHYNPGYHKHGDRELSDCDGVLSNFSERLSVKKNTTASILTITDAKPEDAGKYECEDENNGRLLFTTEVIVIDESPKCSSTVRKIFSSKIGKESASQTKSKTTLQCKVGFNGSLNATSQCILEWRIVGREDVLDSKCIVGDNSVKLTLTLDAASHSNDTSYVCVVRGSAVQQYSCQTGQIETPLTPKNTAVTTATTIPNRQHVKRLTMKVRQSFFDFVQNFLNSAKAESRFRHLQRQTLCNLSKILQLKKGCDHRKEKVIV